MHPLPILLNHGVPITLNSDDPSAFGNMGLSFDFFQVLIASEVTGLLTAKAIARDSLKVCVFPLFSVKLLGVELTMCSMRAFQNRNKERPWRSSTSGGRPSYSGSTTRSDPN